MTHRPSPAEVIDAPPPQVNGTDILPPVPGRPSSPRARRQAVLSLAAGLALLLSAPVAFISLRPAPAGQQVVTVGADRAAALRAPAAAQAPPIAEATPPGAAAAATSSSTVPPSAAAAAALPSAPPEPPPPAEPAQPTAPVASPPPAVAAAPQPAAVAEPARIRVSALGVDAAVVPIGVQDSGELEIPADVSTVGWYRYGPMPGADTGSAVLSGHVDAVDQGPGTFARLGDLEPGDTVEVVDAAGATRAFTVVAREEWDKADVPLDRIFDRGGAGRLVLITCGGTFDRQALAYQDNIAVTAVLSEG